MIANNATAEDISLKAQQNGTRLLRDNVSKMVLSGTTTMEELIRATYSV